jgi:lipopolysaccharide/colanic/teichoic acid biosynthesis glycosyltransferase
VIADYSTPVDGSAAVPDLNGRIAGNSTSWNHSRGKRLLDVFLASLAILACLPVMAIVGLVVAATSRGPILFGQDRLGKNGQPFRLLKFRTMRHGETQGGPLVTQSGDSRVTPAGRWLRRWKLDELPQLFNVLRGDMCLVGPRPDVAKFLRELPPECRHLLSLTPGLTGWATLQLRNEEKLLAGVSREDLPGFYIHQLLPRKAQLDLEYAARASFRSDLQVLANTLLVIFGSR